MKTHDETSSFALVGLAAKAQFGGEGGGTDDCPSGSCTKYRVDGETVKCTACCPKGKDPQCSDLVGCTCKS